jgi:hypothetical protein
MISKARRHDSDTESIVQSDVLTLSPCSSDDSVYALCDPSPALNRGLDTMTPHKCNRTFMPPTDRQIPLPQTDAQVWRALRDGGAIGHRSRLVKLERWYRTKVHLDCPSPLSRAITRNVIRDEELAQCPPQTWGDAMTAS